MVLFLVPSVCYCDHVTFKPFDQLVDGLLGTLLQFCYFSYNRLSAPSSSQRVARPDQRPAKRFMLVFIVLIKKQPRSLCKTASR